MLARQHFQRFKFRDVFCDRIVEVKLAIFMELHQGNARDRLRHGIDPVQRARLHGCRCFNIPHTVLTIMSNLTVFDEQGLKAHDMPVRDELLQAFVERMQSIRAERLGGPGRSERRPACYLILFRHCGQRRERQRRQGEGKPGETPTTGFQFEHCAHSFSSRRTRP